MPLTFGRTVGENTYLDFKGNSFMAKGARFYQLIDGEYKMIKRFYRTIMGMYHTGDLFVVAERKWIRRAKQCH